MCKVARGAARNGFRVKYVYSHGATECCRVKGAPEVSVAQVSPIRLLLVAILRRTRCQAHKTQARPLFGVPLTSFLHAIYSSQLHEAYPHSEHWTGRCMGEVHLQDVRLKLFVRAHHVAIDRTWRSIVLLCLLTERLRQSYCTCVSSFA